MLRYHITLLSLSEAGDCELPLSITHTTLPLSPVDRPVSSHVLFHSTFVCNAATATHLPSRGFSRSLNPLFPFLSVSLTHSLIARCTHSLTPVQYYDALILSLGSTWFSHLLRLTMRWSSVGTESDTPTFRPVVM